MAETKTAVANKPAWVDLATPDAAASRDFYSKVFGWNIEVDPERWHKVTVPAIGHIEDLLLVGDFEGALQLAATFANETADVR